MFEHFTRDSRATLMFAMDEAVDLGSDRLGNEHLILGMLCNARSPIYTTLTDLGLTLDGARTAVREFAATRPDDDEADTTAESDDREIVDEDREALKAIGIDLDKVVAAVRDRFGSDITEGWGRRGSERRGSGRGRSHHGHPRGPHGRSQGGPCGEPGWERGQRGPWDREEFGPGRGGPWGADGPWRDGPWREGRGRRGPRGRGGPFGRSRFSADAKAALAYAVEDARGAGDPDLIEKHVLIGILRVDDAASRALIESVTTPEQLREALTVQA
ncbi:Clp protease N-terminal domain-containing protein [Williamsia sterculiae]|uniref:Clp amino terminal domain-containing protein, pathogenicity island component n=1 Tax=Williamsia sterculiae TaxID=1344003 RepID=A0A1N7CXT0_9NOCA|nr:Clp protease N-terminal domain-containing protein [Williamsia sterculiae]SIR68448.1 Clp amino terminal domain-containing protein, pathogenicity island component [Williamsia sterculiae]